MLYEEIEYGIQRPNGTIANWGTNFWGATNNLIALQKLGLFMNAYIVQRKVDKWEPYSLTSK